VFILDNRNRVAERIDDLSHIPCLEVDITNSEQVQEVIQDLAPDVVFHLAAIHFIPECNSNPERTLRVNVEATQTLLSACARARVGHFLLASSGAVYADSKNPLSETSHVDPVDIYGLSKLFAEQLAQKFAQHEGLRVTALRLFNNYGPRETNAHIIPEIIHQLKQSNVLRLGNIKPRRDYIHTADTAHALRRLGENPPESWRVVNVSSGVSSSVEDLIQIFSTNLNRELVIQPDPLRFRRADKLVQIADISLLKRITGWEPEIDFQQGIRDLLRFEGLLP
jgi:UDP-glucose 4-epimerase